MSFLCKIFGHKFKNFTNVDTKEVYNYCIRCGFRENFLLISVPKDEEKEDPYSKLLNKAITEIKGKYPGDDSLKKMDDAERQKLQQAVNFTRYWCVRTSIKLEALAPKITAFNDSLEEMKKAKKPIIETPVPEYKHVDAYVVKINKLFVAGVMSDLLTKAQDVYSKYTGQESGQ